MLIYRIDSFSRAFVQNKTNEMRQKMNKGKDGNVKRVEETTKLVKKKMFQYVQWIYMWKLLPIS